MFTETWTATDSTDLSADRTWTEIPGATGGAIVSGEVRCPSGGEICIARCEVDLLSVNHYNQGIVGASEETDTANSGVCVRFAPDAQTYYAAYAEFAANQVEIYEVIATTYRLVASGAVTLNAGTTYLLRLEVDDGDLVAKINGVTIASVLGEIGIPTGTRIGIELNKATAGYVSIDTLEAGELGAAAAATTSDRGRRSRR